MPVKFRRSKGNYFVTDGVVYKGIGSIPYMNDRISEEMYALKDNKYTNFIDVLYALKNNTSIDSRQTTKLIEVDFFSEFGDINELLFCKELFEKLDGKQQVAKNKIDEVGIGEEILREFSNEETYNRVEEIDCSKFVESLGYTESQAVELLADCVKSAKNPQYSTKKVIKKFNPSEEQIQKFATKIVYGKFAQIRTYELMYYLLNHTEIEKCTMSEKIRYQFENLGYVDYVDPSLDWRYVAVTGLNTSYSPRFGAYSLSNGKTVDMKIHKTKGRNKNVVTCFNDVPLENCDVIYIKNVKKEPKRQKVNDDWVDIPNEFEWWIKDYIKVI